MKPKVAAAIEELNAGLPGDFITPLITLLLNLPCFKQEQTDPATFLQKHYNEKRKTYTRAVVVQAARAADNKPEFEGLSRREVRERIIATFDRARTSPQVAKQAQEEFNASSPPV